MLSLILLFFSSDFHALICMPMRRTTRGADKVIPFMREPCYPYEFASKNKPFGELDGC